MHHIAALQSPSRISGMDGLKSGRACDKRMPMLKKTALAFVVLALSVPPLAAQDRAGKASDPQTLKFSFTERIRQESSDNAASLDESKNDVSSCMRMRTCLTMDWKPSKNLEFNIRLTNENRYYLSPKTDPKLHKNYSLNEVVIDNLFVKWTRPAGLPVALTLGRQDIRMGEGFLIFDGAALDGSRTGYFNGLRADFLIDARNTLMVFYVRQPRTDTYLPVIHDVGQAMGEQEDESYGLYHTAGIGKINVEGYLFRINRKRFGSLPSSRFQTAGGRIQIPVAKRLSLTAEGALQFGKRETVDRTGSGGYFHLDYKTGSRGAVPAVLTLGGIYLSGDDLSTPDKYEGWDPAFSRWPKWSDSFIYLLAKETSVAFWSNFVSLYAGANFDLASNIRLNLNWHHLTAAERTAPSNLWSGAGQCRGDLGIVKLTYDISPHLQGHFIWEQFDPGSFYFAGANGYAWIRFELMIKY